MEDDSIKSKDPNIDQVIYQILNEAYQEFKKEYGNEHSEYIKSTIESITDKVRYDRDTYYMAATAMANRELGIVYSTTKNISAILKHEMWHVYNSTNQGNSLLYISEKYKEQLDNNGYLIEEYNNLMNYYKEEFKDDSERLKSLICTFEEFKQDNYSFGHEIVEMWTEWFNNETHKKDMNSHFKEFGDGYFIQRNSSGSYYDCFLNIANMISCLIPKDKLLDMYLEQGEYKTGYSYEQMTEEFDEKYSGAINGDEQEYYKYPMLKIIFNVHEIYENTRKNPQDAIKALQSAMKTCFNAYLIKLDNIKDLDVEKAKMVYSEIKQMQEHMMWNIDPSKMQNQDYIQAMIKIQEKFKRMLNGIDLSNPEVAQMLENIDYTAENQYALNQDGEEIVQIMLKTSNDEKEENHSNIKDNLYRSLFVLLGKNKLNLLYQNFSENNEKDNVLLRIHKKIQVADTDEIIQEVYNEIYDLYLAKISERLNINDNIVNAFKVVQNEIIELQKNGLFNSEKNRYMGRLEQIIELYKQRIQDYEVIIEDSIPGIIQNYIDNGGNIERATEFARRLPDEIIEKLEIYKENINRQRENQITIKDKTREGVTTSYQKIQIKESDVTNAFQLIQKTKQEQEKIQDAKDRNS